MIYGRRNNFLIPYSRALPNDPDALNLLGVVRAKQNRPAEAEQLFRRALARSPAHVSAHINLGELLLTTNRSQEAMVILLRAHKLAPTRPDINLNLGRLYLEKNNYQQAREHLRLVPREAFNDDYFLLSLRTLIGLKQTDEVRNLDREFRNLVQVHRRQTLNSRCYWPKVASAKKRLVF